MHVRYDMVLQIAHGVATGAGLHVLSRGEHLLPRLSLLCIQISATALLHANPGSKTSAIGPEVAAGSIDITQTFIVAMC